MRKTTISCIAAIVLVLGVGYLAAEESVEFDNAEEQEAAALSSREWAGRAVCGPGREPEWLDDMTLRCLRPLPQVAGARP